jgi:hypothetical protein
LDDITDSRETSEPFDHETGYGIGRAYGQPHASRLFKVLEIEAAVKRPSL